MTTPSVSSPSFPPSQAPPSRRPCWFWAGWEPDRYYRRIGARGTLFFGNGDWVDDWRAALESRETLRAIREAGATIVITRFYKGFGPAVEREDWVSLKEYVSRAHEEGIKVSGYLQGRSLFGEFLFNERPQARDWIARERDGSEQCWGSAYNRFAPCLTSDGYLQMMREVIAEGVALTGLDGIHMDNNYVTHCYCERCRGLFRDWLAQRGDLEALTGIREAHFVEPPPLPAAADFQPDPLAGLWIEFGVGRRLEFMRALRETLREVNPGAVFSGNPAYLKSFASRYTHGLDPALEALAFDSVCVENGNRPRFSDGVLFTQADKHLMSEAGGLKTWVTSWAPDQSGNGYGVPEEAQAVWAGLAEEASFANASLGNTWALRSSGEGAILMKEEKAAAWSVFEEAMRFFRRLEARLEGQPRSQCAELALYIDTATLSLSPSGDAHVVQALLGLFALRRLPFKIVFARQELPPETRTVVLPGQRSLESAEAERLVQWAGREEGRGLWALGPCGMYDERIVPRSRSRTEALWCGAGVRRLDLPLHRWVRRDGGHAAYFRGLSPTFSQEGVSALEPLLAELAARMPVAVDAPAGVLLNLEQLGEDRLLLHLRDLREEAASVEAGAVRLILRRGKGAIAGFSPAWDGEKVFEPQEGDAGAAVSLPAFAHYAALLIPAS
ncbi:MAG TPA: beta-galactosidase [Chthoniobacteraceae bacterium]|nr:beta-galactosidase [Chthoniobacteraceae bacterium]